MLSECPSNEANTCIVIFVFSCKFCALHRNELKQRFGITRAFLATHSGLTRWMDFSSDSDDDFIATNSRSVDEIWYKRAVEQHFVEPQSFVFSVPYNAGKIWPNKIDVNIGPNLIEINYHTDDPDMRPEDIIVTASHAIFHTEDKRSAPVAVVGFQFQHSALLTLFKNTTSNVCPIEKLCQAVSFHLCRFLFLVR